MTHENERNQVTTLLLLHVTERRHTEGKTTASAFRPNRNFFTSEEGQLHYSRNTGNTATGKYTVFDADVTQAIRALGVRPPKVKLTPPSCDAAITWLPN